LASYLLLPGEDRRPRDCSALDDEAPSQDGYVGRIGAGVGKLGRDEPYSASTIDMRHPCSRSGTTTEGKRGCVDGGRMSSDSTSTGDRAYS
jgi:hypothetical protein